MSGNVKVHNGTEQCMDHLQTSLKEADLHILMHVLDCVRAGYSTCIALSNNTDVIIALLYYVPVFHKEGLKELWVRAGRCRLIYPFCATTYSPQSAGK